MTAPSYRQPTKNAVRSQALATAIGVLTEDRAQATLIQLDKLRCVLDYAVSQLKRCGVSTPWETELSERVDAFASFHGSLVGQRKAAELRVLYLCGPEPKNDLSLMIDMGCRPENIWGIESDKEHYKQATEQLRGSALFPRIHHGDFRTFCQLVNDRFDIVYFDGCGPLPGRKRDTTTQLLSMFVKERLEDLSVLVTTVAEVPSEKKAEYSELLAHYFSPRHRDSPQVLLDAGYDPAIGEHEVGYTRSFIAKNLDAVYSEFVTRLIVDLGRHVAPLAKAGSNPHVVRKLLVESNQLKKHLASALNGPRIKKGQTAEKILRSLLESSFTRVRPASFPVLTFLERGRKSQSAANLLGGLLGANVDGSDLMKSYLPFALLEAAEEGYFNLASEELLAALRVGWFDRRESYFCDIPMTRLLVTLLIATYGHPYFVNPSLSRRFSYQAKSTQMYTDVLVFDRCRSLFDSMPTVDLVPSRFESIPFQLLVRACMDQISWHDYDSSSKPFSGCALGCIDEHEAAKPIHFRARESFG